jgi:DNA-binding NarL/FixJ family response regulator
LTASQDRLEIETALELGAKAVVLKEAPTRELLKVMRQVHQGFPCPDRATQIAALESTCFASNPNGYPHPRSGPELEHWDDLTPRETEIALLVSQGLPYKQIIRQLTMRSSTLNNHLRSIFEKLQINGRVELALHARRHSS